MVKFSYKTLVQKTGMKEHDVRYRVDKMDLGEKVGERFSLYSEEDVKRVVNYPKAYES